MKIQLQILFFCLLGNLVVAQNTTDLGVINTSPPFTNATGDNTSSGNNYPERDGNDVYYSFTTDRGLSLNISFISPTSLNQSNTSFILLDANGDEVPKVGAFGRSNFNNLPTGNYTLIVDADAGNTGSFSFVFRPLGADFTAAPTMGNALPLVVFFIDESTFPDTWSWNFGDGTTSILQDPIHAYTTTGAFDVRLTVSDTIFGTTNTRVVSELVKISIPTANFTGNGTAIPVAGCNPLNVNYEDTSVENGAPIVSWDWDFGDGNTSSLQNPNHQYNTGGMYEVSLTVTDDFGNTSTEVKSNFVQVMGPSANFSTTDTTAGCLPLTINFQDDSTSMSPITQWFWDFGDGNTSSQQNPMHMYSTSGIYDVSFQVTDVNGCSNTIIETAFIDTLDNESPVANCVTPFTLNLDSNGQASITVADIDNSSTDNCSIDMMTIDMMNFDCSNLGTNTVTLTVTDTAGNVGTCSTTVTIQDNVAPTASCVTPFTVQLDALGMASITMDDVNNGSTDACGIASTSIDVTEFTCADVGTPVTVTLTVTDNNMNTATCTTTVTVLDNELPVATCVSPFILNLDANGQVSISVTDIDNGSTDNCGIDTMMVDVMDFDCTNLGDNTVTLTVIDVAGNVATCSTVVTVQDIEGVTVSSGPVDIFTGTGAGDSDCGAIVNYGPITIESFVISDNCGDASSTTVSFTNGLGSGAFFPVGTSVEEYTLIDSNGNETQYTFDIIITDTAAPVINCPGEIIVSEDENGEYVIADYSNTVIDNCSSGSDLVVIQDPVAGTVVGIGATMISLMATDNAGNMSNCNFNLIVDSTLGVGEESFRESIITLYPNPVENVLHIKTEALTMDEVTIYDLRGRVISHQSSLESNLIDIDVTNIKTGVYLVRITSGNSIKVKRFVRQ
ncbi:PKD domain-containing protein [Dokdonia sinensis]|uniref:PKD domain-containing protein n=1 Tax=Dokdonia sinensis TaxID=2479847 RepID=A0A3M0G8T6_9FLAO|nr:PKD domain-containing protein [Dokdonia sinensis]RMB58043.1 PKD domain-containing protein [Dokdonia sinensis]